MNILAVIAHPSESSLCHSILDYIKSIVESSDCSIFTRDLYKLNFNPILSNQDLNSYRIADISNDIQVEQNYVSNADLIIIIYPVWWGGMPAILKGYFDRVFSLNFAYKIENEIALPMLTDKKIISISTQGETKDKYEANGMFAAMEKIFQEGIYSFCGINSLKPIYFEDVKSFNHTNFSDKLQNLTNLLKKCETF